MTFETRTEHGARPNENQGSEAKRRPIRYKPRQGSQAIHRRRGEEIGRRDGVAHAARLAPGADRGAREGGDGGKAACTTRGPGGPRKPEPELSLEVPLPAGLAAEPLPSRLLPAPPISAAVSLEQFSRQVLLLAIFRKEWGETISPQPPQPPQQWLSQQRWSPPIYHVWRSVAGCVA